MWRPMALLLLWLVVSQARGQPPLPEADTFFELKIRPVLAGTCFKCHGGQKVSHGLRVDSREALLKGGDAGPAIVPGAPEKSLLVQASRHTHEAIKMPPDKRLPDEAVNDFTTWVKRGATWPETSSSRAKDFTKERHWAFERVTPVQPPADPGGWSDHPIDRFVAAKRREHGVTPVDP